MAIIGIFDSGSGGLSVFREIRKVLPYEHYIYYSDNANCPYGEKSPEFIRARARKITDELLADGASAIVVACNTATGAAIADLRSRYDIPFIGMEPAVKPAALGTKSGVIGVLATEGTLKASNYLKNKGRFKDEVRIEESVGRGFVDLVENLELSGLKAETVVEKSVRPLIDAGADMIVLGCTHYPFLTDVIRKVAGPDIQIVNPAPAVAKHLVEVLRMQGIPETDPEPQTELIASGPEATLKALFNVISD